MNLEAITAALSRKQLRSLVESVRARMSIWVGGINGRRPAPAR